MFWRVEQFPWNQLFHPMFFHNIRPPRTLPRSFRGHSFRFRGHSFHFRGRSRSTIHFRSASANPAGFQTPSAKAWAELPRCGFFTSRSSYFKPKIKRIHGGFGRCSCVHYHFFTKFTIHRPRMYSWRLLCKNFILTLMLGSWGQNVVKLSLQPGI
jgi:hypothetical protein